MKNLILIAVCFIASNAFAMNSFDYRKETILTKKIGNENICLEIAASTAPTIANKMQLTNDSEFSLKCLAYMSLNNMYALVANVSKIQKAFQLRFSFLDGLLYKIKYQRKESKPHALLVEDHIIQNGEIRVLRSSRPVDYSVVIPFERKYNLASVTDVFGNIRRDIEMYGKESNILGFVYNPSSVLKASGILIHLDSN